MASLRSPLVILAAVLATACAKSVPVTANETGGQVSAAANVQRWSAPLKQPSMTASSVLSTTTSGATAASYGSATLTQSPGTGHARYEVTVTVPPAANRQVAWALFTGSCGTASPPVVPVNELPPIDLDASGSGAARGSLTTELSPKATYNLRVYGSARASDVNNVVLCARLGYSGRR
jgi:hypothetical protein